MGKRGPKAKADYASKGATLSARISTVTRDLLEKSAKASGNSISQEVEGRLARTFLLDDDAAYKNLGPSPEYWLLRMMAEVIRECEEFTDKTWSNDAFTWHVVFSALNSFAKAFKPEGAITVPDGIEPLRKLPDGSQRQKGHAEHVAFLKSVKPSAWGEMMAGSILQRLEQARSPGESSPEALIFKLAAEQLAPVQTTDSLGHPHTSTKGRRK